MIFDNDIDNCVSVLEKGGIILYPTDTIWGIGCDATNEQAVKKVYALKKREETKSMIILVSKEENIGTYAQEPCAEIRNELQNNSNPLTVIYPNAKNLAPNLFSPDQTIAIRIPKDDFCRNLITSFGKPLVSTSANISGETTAVNFDEVSDEIKKSVDYIVLHRREEKIKSSPSRIIKWGGDKIIIIRE